MSLLIAWILLTPFTVFIGLGFLNNWDAAKIGTTLIVRIQALLVVITWWGLYFLIK